MSRPRKNALFELGGQWIGTISGSAALYRFWFDPRNGRTSRASLGTEDIEEAKLKLATLVLKGGKQSANAMLATVLEKYFLERTDKLPSKQAARAAGRLLLNCWGATCRANEFTETKQKEFVDWSIAKGHSLSYLSRNLSVLAAAFSHSKIRMGLFMNRARCGRNGLLLRSRHGNGLSRLTRSWLVSFLMNSQSIFGGGR